ncbi:PAP/fibrillin family protein [Geminocystis sp. GBBB08]|uniref:PAP/fibrillin family protein n=1 Tax=Geminocystis sp. GBBB08 TaxID=2604140 RepID=UPI0027E333D8|nr:PAP/fibrillin family protein [Geminocystis sp. GBBB08]MBL1209058.1 fibrillin [Geminocystis sp. GBBB08]
MSLKIELLKILQEKNRGLLATENDRVKILTAVEKLEDQNPNPNPFDDLSLVNGDWRLLYTSSRSILSLDNIPLLQLGEIYQCIRTDTSKIYNLAQINSLPFLEGLVSVTANVEIVSAKRVKVKFERSIIGLQKLLGYISPDDFIDKIEVGKYFLPLDFNLSFFSNNNQQGWLEITYLDENLRISRGNEGNIFILERFVSANKKR